MRTLAKMLCVVGLAGCGRAPRQPAAAAPAAPSAAAAPVLVPMAVREHLLHDLAEQKRQARERAESFDEAAGRDH
ncbi:MAG TPA: hypothetical protein VFZ65_03285 [Planctomycetota bacterium]|nr:hypothetical protein [Planctomycetota bacterium]